MLLSKNPHFTLGKRLRDLRLDSNLSLREVSQKTGIDISLLGKIERDERQATKDQIHYLATFYHLKEKDLLKELISDQLAFILMEEKADQGTLKAAQLKFNYLKNHKNVK
jgi:transcriptional regulator with XRE-family HTH domain